jgi:hypothetical protein
MTTAITWVLPDLALSLRTDVELGREEPAVPRLDRWADAAHAVDLTDQLLEREQADARHLHRLRRELQTVADATMWPPLVELIERDTAKDVKILDFVSAPAKQLAEWRLDAGSASSEASCSDASKVHTLREDLCVARPGIGGNNLKP